MAPSSGEPEGILEVAVSMAVTKARRRAVRVTRESISQRLVSACHVVSDCCAPPDPGGVNLFSCCS